MHVKEFCRQISRFCPTINFSSFAQYQQQQRDKNNKEKTREREREREREMGCEKKFYGAPTVKNPDG